MTSSKKTLSGILSVLLVALAAIMPLVYFFENRDTAGFFTWLLLFATFLSVQPDPKRSPVAVRIHS